jgi:ABC-2 type transport system ATP-binding protein
MFRDGLLSTCNRAKRIGRGNVFGLPISDDRNSVTSRQRIGFVTEEKELYPYMTVRQVIQFTRPFFPRWRSDLEQRYLRMFELPLNRKIPDTGRLGRAISRSP